MEKELMIDIILGCTLLMLFVFIIIEVSYNNKKSDKKFNNKSREISKYAETSTAKQRERINLLEKKINAFTIEQSEKFDAYFTNFDFYTEFLTEILEEVPNKKVKEKTELFKEKWENQKKEIQKYLLDTKDEINKLKEEVASLREKIGEEKVKVKIKQ